MYEHESTVEHQLDRVWDWFARPGAMNRLTPGFLPGRPARESDSLWNGTAVLDLPGPFHWLARHDPAEYRQGRRFVDVAVGDDWRSRPVAAVVRWRHEHEFEPVPGGTLVRDRVSSTVPDLVLRRMFTWRHRQLADDLAAVERLGLTDATPLTVALTGSEGTVGSALSAFLSTAGTRVVHLVPRPARSPVERHWDVDCPDSGLLDDVDAVVHLADTPLATSTALAEVATRAQRGPTVWVAPTSGHAAPALLADAGIRVVGVRAGLPLSLRGGGLRHLVRAGAPTADTWINWIDLDDLTDVLARAVVDPTLSGTVHATSPHPVTGAGFDEAVRAAHGRAAPLLAPVRAVRGRLGDIRSPDREGTGSPELPHLLEQAGHTFRRPDLTDCLRHQLGH